ncbi:hypothetical protein [Scytonema sp. UIC 10036]|uniref:hypothetical protein n=1 Tax=Scytonema sp. UIC 10036 TaxID=2304196 RepID=UPI00140F970F|nr:hypothetical protein [Scytonema sp. UIC 10036]
MAKVLLNAQYFCKTRNFSGFADADCNKDVVAQLTSIDTYSQRLIDVAKVTFMKQWSYGQALNLRKKDYRQGYLQERKNS